MVWTCESHTYFVEASFDYFCLELHFVGIISFLEFCTWLDFLMFDFVGSWPGSVSDCFLIDISPDSFFSEINLCFCVRSTIAIVELASVLSGLMNCSSGVFLYSSVPNFAKSALCTSLSGLPGTRVTTVESEVFTIDATPSIVS